MNATSDIEKALNYYRAAVEDGRPDFVPARVRLARRGVAGRGRQGRQGRHNQRPPMTPERRRAAQG